MSDIPTPSEAMMKRSLEWLEVTLNLRDGPHRFQAEIASAMRIDPKTVEEAISLIGLAYAAITVSNTKDGWSEWYRDQAQTLMGIAVNGLALIERGAAELN